MHFCLTTYNAIKNRKQNHLIQISKGSKLINTYYFMKENKNYILPLAILGLMFFSGGFAASVNGILIPILNQSLEVSSAGAYALIAAMFIPFVLFGYPCRSTYKGHWLQENNCLFVCYLRC